jgi:hypothetical protein
LLLLESSNITFEISHKNMFTDVHVFNNFNIFICRTRLKSYAESEMHYPPAASIPPEYCNPNANHPNTQNIFPILRRRRVHICPIPQKPKLLSNTPRQFTASGYLRRRRAGPHNLLCDLLALNKPQLLKHVHVRERCVARRHLSDF